MIELNGEDYVLFIVGMNSEQLLQEMIKQTVTFHSLAQQDAVTDGDIFRYNMVAMEVFKRMER